MKRTILLILLTMSMNSFGITYTDTVPGKNYTYREYLINRAIVNQFRQVEQKEKLQGEGIEFFGNVSIKEEESEDKDGKKTTKKVYKVYIRNCGTIKIPDKDEKIMKKLSNGTRIRLYLNGSSCSVSNWEIF